MVVLPDIILDGGTADPLRYNLAAMVARFNETGRSQVLAKRMSGDLSEYSVIQTKEPMVGEGPGRARIVEFIEKPDEPQTLDPIDGGGGATCCRRISGPNWSVPNRVPGAVSSQPTPLPNWRKSSPLTRC